MTEQKIWKIKSKYIAIHSPASAYSINFRQKRVDIRGKDDVSQRGVYRFYITIHPFLYKVNNFISNIIIFMLNSGEYLTF